MVLSNTRASTTVEGAGAGWRAATGPGNLFRTIAAATALAVLGLSLGAADNAARADTVSDLVDGFAGSDGYSSKNPEALQSQLRDMLEGDPGSVFLADRDLNPLAKAILAVEAAEGVLPHLRYRIRYGVALIDAPPAADPLPVSLVTIDRFNLGPARRDQLADIHGADNVAPPEHFGEGPHVSYRLVMRPIMGQTADIVGAGRAVLAGPDGDCLGFDCLSPDGFADHAAEWEGMDEIGAPEIDATYEILRDGALSPAAAVDHLAVEMGLVSLHNGQPSWSGFEPREGVAPGEPFAEAVIEVNLAQDTSVDAFMREGAVMDHAIAAVWGRVVSVAGADLGAPMTFGGHAAEHRPGQD